MFLGGRAYVWEKVERWKERNQEHLVFCLSNWNGKAKYKDIGWREREREELSYILACYLRRDMKYTDIKYT